MSGILLNKFLLQIYRTIFGRICLELTFAIINRNFVNNFRRCQPIVQKTSLSILTPSNYCNAGQNLENHPASPTAKLVVKHSVVLYIMRIFQARTRRRKNCSENLIPVKRELMKSEIKFTSKTVLKWPKSHAWKTGQVVKYLILVTTIFLFCKFYAKTSKRVMQTFKLNLLYSRFFWHHKLQQTFPLLLHSDIQILLIYKNYPISITNNKGKWNGLYKYCICGEILSINDHDFKMSLYVRVSNEIQAFSCICFCEPLTIRSIFRVDLSTNGKFAEISGLRHFSCNFDI